MGSSLIQIGQALSGAALPLAYGPCRVRGNNVLNQQLANNNRIALYILGEGPWDGIDRLWMNGKLIDLTTTTLIHFHNGFDGTLGAGLAPTSFGGDQGVDQFWSLLPSNFQPLTLSRKAYLMVQAVPDPQAPSNTLDVVADYRTMRVRIFDATGAQTAFQYSLNPAWQILDVIIREMLNREWTTAGAAAGGGDLTAAMKARISFTSFKAAADICDTVLASGAKTFEGGVAWPSLTGMQQALDTLCTLSQTYLVEQGGQITLLPDQARPSTFTLTSSHITAGSFQATKSQLRGAQNRFIGTFNDINAQKNADIDTVGNVGLSRTANVTTVVVPAGQVHGFLVGDNVDIVNPTDASFAGTITVATVPNTRTITGAQTGANTTSGGGYVGTTESRFAQRTKVIDHEQHQLAVGQRGLNLSPVYKRVPVTIDFGNNTMERVERLLNFIKTRNLGVDATPYAAPFSAKVQASFYAVDATNNVLAAQLPGDILTIDATISEEFQGDYEIMKISYARPTGEASNSQSGGADQSAQAEVLNLTLKQYLPAAFSTLSNTAQSLVASIARKGLPPAESVDGTGSLVVSLGKTVDDATTSRFAVVQIDGARRPITDFASAHLNKNTDNIADATGSPLTGGKRGFVAIDGGNVLVAGSADFSRAYTGKHLGNIPDNVASARFAVASIDAARKALIDFAQTHTNKHLDNMPDGTTYSRCRGSQLQNGSLIRGGGGKNLLANPGFENNVSLTPVSTSLAANADAADEWFVFGVSAFHSVSIDTVVPRGGANSLLIRLNQGVTVPNDSVLYQTRVWTKAKLAVRIGDIVRVAGYARWDNDTAVPAGVFATQRIGLAFFNAADSFLGELNADITNGAAGTGAYGVLQGSLQVPATLGGGVPAYCRVQCCGFIQNTSGAALVTGIHTYADLRFDDLMVVLQNTAFDLTPVNTASTNLSTVNPLSQSGTSSTINVAATTYQFADGQVSYNSGTVNPGYGLWGVTADDPTFVGGAVSYAAQSTGAGTIANNGRQLFGDITTAASPGGATGSGGGTGGAGPKGKGQLGL